MSTSSHLGKAHKHAPRITAPTEPLRSAAESRRDAQDCGVGGGRITAASCPDDDSRLPCIMNGVLVPLSWSEAHRLLHASDVGIIVPLNWYRCRLGASIQQGFVEKALKAGLQFGLGLLSHRPMSPFPIHEAEDYFGTGRLSPVAFHNRARLFARLLGVDGSGRPFEHDCRVEGPGKGTRAYRVKEGCTWLIVLAPPEDGCLDDLHELINPPPDASSPCERPLPSGSLQISKETDTHKRSLPAKGKRKTA